MEKITEIKPFYAYKTTLRALSDGFSLMSRNATMCLKVCGPLLLVLSLAGGWLAYEGMQLANNLMVGVLPSTVAASVCLLFPVVLSLICMLLIYALFYALFSMYIEKGFIPLLTFRSVCKPMLRKSRRLLLVAVWAVFVIGVYVALAVYLAYLSRWTLIATALLGLFLCFWITNQATEFLLGSNSLWSAIVRSLGITVKGLGSFLVAAVLIFIIDVVLTLLFAAPATVGELINYRCQLSALEGDASSLPGYFMPFYFFSSALYVCLNVMMGLVFTSCWCMVYGAVTTRLRHKKEGEAIG